MNLEQELKKMASDEQPSAILKEKTIQRMEQETQNYLKPKWKPVLLASILIIVLVGTAYAVGWLPAWTDRYAEDFGDELDQKALIEELGIPLGISASEGGITITAESMLYDGKTAIIMLSAKRDNGEPLVSKDAKGFDQMVFGVGPVSETENIMFTVRSHESVIPFKNYTPGDTVGYYFGYYTVNGSEPEKMILYMNSLYAWYNDREEILTEDPFAEWRLMIPLQNNDTRKLVATGVTIETDAEVYLLKNLYISPLAVTAEYEVESTKPSERREVLEYFEDGSEASVTWHEEDFVQDLTLIVRLKNGEEIDMSIMTDNNGIKNLMGLVKVDEAEDKFRIRQGGVLPEIIPLERIDCVIICGKKYPVS